MARYDLIPHADIAGLVDDRLARRAPLDDIDDLKSILPPR
jgi:hypothetical protein